MDYSTGYAVGIAIGGTGSYPSDPTGAFWLIGIELLILIIWIGWWNLSEYFARPSAPPRRRSMLDAVRQRRCSLKERILRALLP